MKILPSEQTNDLKSRLHDAIVKSDRARDAYEQSACADVLAHFAGLGIAVGDKVVIVDRSALFKTVVRTVAFFAGASYRHGSAMPTFRKVKADGTASAKAALFSHYSSEVERVT